MAERASVRSFDARSIARAAILLAALGFFGVMLARLSWRTAQRQGWWNPIIAAEPAELDLGTLAANSTRRCSFAVENLGQRPLRIERIRVGCSSCLKLLKRPTAPVSPHGRVEVLAEFRTHGLKGPAIRTLAIESNDPIQPSLIVKIKATIRPNP
jgi:hypothetical protein